ncbi:MAG: hypothetical protein CO108_03095 [Deltaproteobacteria bacterium CG_4_9_14_3_um_filter_63_12]|nr:MAG: hypothetical protein COW42_11095 [Deltaproteobacteria bacterium CG17_big_fil_post_rev_8_21_14_2_50_63_7]PJB48031.1 MAG: hypothetical protein CO108_03095 [Deltaproteobacteria bacterium CG_4_9_14_3_um_filter_63_12]
MAFGFLGPAVRRTPAPRRRGSRTPARGGPASASSRRNECSFPCSRQGVTSAWRLGVLVCVQGVRRPSSMRFIERFATI